MANEAWEHMRAKILALIAVHEHEVVKQMMEEGIVRLMAVVHTLREVDDRRLYRHVVRLLAHA